MSTIVRYWRKTSNDNDGNRIANRNTCVNLSFSSLLCRKSKHPLNTKTSVIDVMMQLTISLDMLENDWMPMTCSCIGFCGVKNSLVLHDNREQPTVNVCACVCLSLSLVFLWCRSIHVEINNNSLTISIEYELRESRLVFSHHSFPRWWFEH